MDESDPTENEVSKGQNKLYGRAIRGYAIIAKGEEPKRLGKETYQVSSQNGNGKYIITKNGSTWSCTCPDHTYRKVDCKHINAVRLWLKLKERMESADVFDLPKAFEDISKCQYCGSVDVVKWGSRQNKSGKKQVYKCKSCGQRFVVNEGFLKMRVDPRIITVALDLYYKGASLRKVCDHIKQFYGLKVSHMAILKWIRKYTKIINQYVDSLTPQLSDTWHADEMMIDIKGEWKWLWNVMDEETRFMLSNVITENREIDDARRVFAEAKTRARTKPDIIITDGLWSYIDAYRKEFFTLRSPRTKHIRNVGFRDKSNNNIIERLHGTIRERDKVMRALKSMGTGQTIIDGLRAYYNFIRPHMTLDGKTPAQQAIDLDLGENRWRSIIRKATTR